MSALRAAPRTPVAVPAALRLAWSVLGWAATGFVAAIVLALVVPLAFGGRPYTVLTGSMEPAIAPGDVVVGTRVAPPDVRRGDVVTFKDPADAGRMITHRVKAARVQGSKFVFTTKGDANTASERWQVSRGDTLSRVAYRVPEIGHVARFAHGPTGVLLLVLLPLALLGFLEVRRIWRPAEDDGA
jgi:signal peptidase I